MNSPMAFDFLITFTAVFLFSICARLWIMTLRRPIPLYTTGEYSKTALRFRKFYISTAWGLMTFAFLGAMILSWVHLWRETAHLP